MCRRDDYANYTITDVTLHFILCSQKLTEECHTKEAELFDSNLGVLSNHLHSKTFDGHLVTQVKGLLERSTLLLSYIIK